MVTHEKGHISRGSAASPPRERGPSVHRILGTPVVWPRVMKFGMITRGRGACFLRSASPSSQGPQCSAFWGPLCLCPLMYNYQIWHGNTYRKGRVIRGSTVLLHLNKHIRRFVSDSWVSGFSFWAMVYEHCVYQRRGANTKWYDVQNRHSHQGRLRNDLYCVEWDVKL